MLSTVCNSLNGIGLHHLNTDLISQ